MEFVSTLMEKIIGTQNVFNLSLKFYFPLQKLNYLKIFKLSMPKKKKIQIYEIDLIFRKTAWKK